MSCARNVLRCSGRLPKVGRSVTSAPCADSGELGMPRTLFVASILMVACAACGGNDDAADPTETPLPTTSAHSTPTSPSPTIPTYLETYGADDRAAYADAVTAYSKFLKTNAGFIARGHTTKDASAFYHRFSIDWVSAWANLAQLANNHVTVTGTTTVKWVRPVSIAVGQKKTAVVLRRCLDESAVVVTQNGKKLDQPNLKAPHVYRVRLEKRVGETWWRAGSAGQGKKC